MTQEQIIEMAKKAGIFRSWPQPYIANEDELQAFAKLVRNAALEEAADGLYGNGLEMSLLRDLREEIRSMKS